VNDAKKNFQNLADQEKALEFQKFSAEDALAVGLLLNEKAKKYPDPLAIEITVNGLVVFRYFAEGTVKDSEFWLERKKNSVNLMNMSSLRFMYWLEMIGETVADRKLNPNDYAAGGGGFPIRLSGTGVIGSICVSGLPNHLDDHQIVVDTLTEFLK
jgi:uncharacterized protein (UPF0303 family)